MDWMEILYQIFELCILPLLGILTYVAITFIRAKAAEFTAKSENEILNKYILMLSETVSDCVIATNQTYVDTLKAEGKFDAEAFQLTFDSIMAILSDEAKEYLSCIYGDLNAYITNRIEAEVKLNK